MTGGGDIAGWARLSLVACCCALLFSQRAQAAPELVLRTVQQAGSIGKYAQPGESALPGLCMEILRAVERVDPALHFTGVPMRAPLRRIEAMLAQDQIDVFFCLLKSNGREQHVRYLPVPLYRVQHRVVQRADDRSAFLNLADLAAAGKRKPVLVMQGTQLQMTLAGAHVPNSEAPSEREALQMLLLGRTDAVYGQDLNLLRNMRESGQESRLRLSPTVFAEEAQYVVVSRRLPLEAEQRLTQALQALERDGTLKALAEKYR